MNTKVALLCLILGVVLLTPPCSIHSPQPNGIQTLEVESSAPLPPEIDVLPPEQSNPRLSPLLDEWLASGIKPKELQLASQEVNILLVGTSFVDVSSIESIASIDWTISLGSHVLILSSLSIPDTIAELLEINGVEGIYCDTPESKLDDLRKVTEVDVTSGAFTHELASVIESISADGPTASKYDGSGVTIGQLGSGCDFGVPDLQHSYHPDSLDATGDGLALTQYTGNASNVDPEVWLSNPNHLLTYTHDGYTFLNLTDWDPVLNMYGSIRYLYGDGGYTSSGSINPYTDRVGFIWLYAWAWDIDVNATFIESIQQDWKLPSPSQIDGDYQVGFSFQQHREPYAKIFAPSLVYRGLDGESHLIVNWDDTMGWNKLWTGGFYYESYSLNDSTDVAEILADFDWDFTDEFSESEYNDLENPIVAHDYNGDGIDDFSLGSLCWIIDSAGFFEDEVHFHGFRSDNQAYALMFDGVNQGTMMASAIAASGNFTYYDSSNQTYFSIQGVAPKAQILSLKASSLMDIYYAHLWAAGYVFDSELGFTPTYSGQTRVSILEDSSSQELHESDVSLILEIKEIFAAPGSLHTNYPGMLHIFMPDVLDYLTPSTNTMSSNPYIVSVGTMALNTHLNPMYGLDQSFQGVTTQPFQGPNYLGYPTPDFICPGLGVTGCMSMYFPYMVPFWEEGDYPLTESLNYSISMTKAVSGSIAAGVCALVENAIHEASLSANSTYVKSVLKSTAVDFGYDPSIQGCGRIDAERACAFIDNGSGFRIEQATSYFDDVELYFGELNRGESATVPIRIFDDAFGSLVTDLSGWSVEYVSFSSGVEYNFSESTYAYNDTITNNTNLPGFFNLRDYVGSSNYDAAISSYEAASFYLSFDIYPSVNPVQVQLLDWFDSDPHDGLPNYFNSSINLGRELTILAQSTPILNTAELHLANSNHPLSDLLIGNLTLAIDECYHPNFTCVIVFWDIVESTDFGYIEDNGNYTMNHTLTISLDADAGLHMGLLTLDDSTISCSVPWTYTVVTQLTEDDGEINPVYEANTQESTPFSGPLRGESSKRYFPVEITNASAKILGFRAFWYDSDVTIELGILDENGDHLISSLIPNQTSFGLVVDIDQSHSKLFYLEIILTTHAWDVLPIRFSIQAMWYSVATADFIELTYTSSQTKVPAPVELGAIINEDRVVFHATATDYLTYPNLPEAAVSSMRMDVSTGMYFQESADLVIPDMYYDPFSGAIDTSQFSWIIVEGIQEDDYIHLECDFTNGDCDFMAWWADTDNSTWSYANSLLEYGMTSDGHPEIFTFTAERSGAIAVACFDYDLVEGFWTLTLDSLEMLSSFGFGTCANFSISDFMRNGTFDIRSIALTSTNLRYSYDVRIHVNTFFSPALSNIVVTGDGNIKTIEWTCSDRNINDEHIYDIHLSSDGGNSYQLLAPRLLDSTYVWDSTGFYVRDDYVVRITAFDNDPLINPDGLEIGYIWPALYDQMESEPFRAGDFSHGLPSVPDLPTSSGPTPTTLLPVDPFNMAIIISFTVTGISLGVMVIFSIAIRRSQRENQMSPA